MCDCYWPSCVGDCGRHIPLHLEDFATGREEVVVWCADCWATAEHPAHWSKWRVSSYELADADSVHPDAPLDTYVVVGYLTDNAVANRDGNRPNVVVGEDEPCETEAP